MLNLALPVDVYLCNVPADMQFPFPFSAQPYPFNRALEVCSLPDC